MNETGTVSNEEKHIQLDNAIYELDSIIAQSQSLLDRITGNCREEKELAKEPLRQVTLMSVLNSGSAVLRDKTEQIRQIIQNINSEIF